MIEMEGISSPIKIEYRTTQGQFTAAHFHKEIEMLYVLNGTAAFIVDGVAVSQILNKSSRMSNYSGRCFLARDSIRYAPQGQPAHRWHHSTHN